MRNRLQKMQEIEEYGMKESQLLSESVKTLYKQIKNLKIKNCRLDNELDDLKKGNPKGMVLGIIFVPKYLFISKNKLIFLIFLRGKQFKRRI